MLGVMTNITDMLQELQGKKTVATKCMILRSLGAFVGHIGVSISNIAPQVCNFANSEELLFTLLPI